MMQLTSLSDLETFAKHNLDAKHHPNDYHFFKLFKCDGCGVAAFELTIEFHTGSKDRDFKGNINGLCLKCGESKRVFSYTGDHRKLLREEQPTCDCGHHGFLVGECERVEGDDGVKGFFDEGVVVGKCSGCGRNRVIVYTD